jgi:hypothetical protein
MKISRVLLPALLLTTVLAGAGCSEQTSQQAVTAAKSADAPPAVSLFHLTKADSKSPEEDLLWDYFDAVDKHQIDTVWEMLSPDLQGMYSMDDRVVFRNFKSAKVKRIYDMTSQSPKDPMYIDARYFYVEVNYETNHLYDSNDKDGENYFMGVIAREKAGAPYKLYELSHVPKLKEVDKDAQEAPGTTVNPLPNPTLR